MKTYRSLEFKLFESTYQASIPEYNFTIEVRKNAYNKYGGDVFGSLFKNNCEISFSGIDTFEECVDLLLEDLVGYFNKKARKAAEYSDRLKNTIDEL